MHSNQNLQDWLGRETRARDHLRPEHARLMQATLDQDPSFADGDALPPLWHWLYFLDAKKASELGRDAHPKRGGFLPPVALPRRMWAGGRFSFHAPLVFGQEVEKRSVIKSIAEKSGQSGKLCFVTVAHEISQGGVLALTEEHDIVYREDPDPRKPAPTPTQAPDNPDFSADVVPTAVMLFRYSALMFNGHRIHYDVDYARDVEGYDGLVFHGPLTATLLVDLAVQHVGRPPTHFEFRGRAPISGPMPFKIQGRRDGDTVDLWARRSDGALAMSAIARF